MPHRRLASGHDRLAQAARSSEFEAVDRLQHAIGALVRIGILGALALGLVLFAGAGAA